MISFLAMGNTSQVAIILGGRECAAHAVIYYSPSNAPLLSPEI
jgi:hypothetical protein